MHSNVIKSLTLPPMSLTIGCFLKRVNYNQLGQVRDKWASSYLQVSMNNQMSFRLLNASEITVPVPSYGLTSLYHIHIITQYLVWNNNPTCFSDRLTFWNFESATAELGPGIVNKRLEQIQSMMNKQLAGSKNTANLTKQANPI